MKKITLLTAGILFCSLTYGQSPFGSKKSISTSTGTLPSTIESGNLNNDSFKDIVIGTTGGNTIEWYKNNGNGSFTLQSLISSTISNIGGLFIADIDGDNKNDIIATSNLDNKLVWFKNDGNGNFGSEILIASGLERANAVKVGDIDNNGTPDVVVSAYASDIVQWYPNNGSGSFGSPNVISNLANYGPKDFDLGDYDNDGDLDVVIAYGKTYLVKLFTNNLIGSSSVSFTDEPNYVSTSDFYLTDVSFGDVDNNGDLEILKINLYTNPAYYNKESDGSFTETIFTTSNTNPSFALISDLDDDSVNDVAVAYSSSSANDPITWYKNSSTTNEVIIDNTQNDIYSFTLNDFDNDGDLDMATISANENHLNWFENNTYAPSLSTNNFDINKISFYPNPTQNKLNFKNVLNDNYKVSVYNLLGKKVLNDQLIGGNKNSLDVSKLNNGVYVLNFENTNTSLKFVKF